MTEIKESEKRRLLSLKEKRKAFKNKGQIIRYALSNALDTKPKNNKIIFEDYSDEEKKTGVKKLKSRPLFDKDDDNTVQVSTNEFNFNEDTPWQTRISSCIGNDKRFILDKRFMEEDENQSEANVVKESDASDLQIEKNKQLNILENVLGTVFPKKINGDGKFPMRKGRMVRYDPSQNAHREYDLTVDKSTPKIEKGSKSAKKAKCSNSRTEAMQNDVTVSKDVYYNVSNNFAERLNQDGNFSLLKTYSKNNDEITTKEDHKNNFEYNSSKKLHFNFLGANPFKYDSSDEEDIKHTRGHTEKHYGGNSNQPYHSNDALKVKDSFFFKTNDVRFEEVQKFFNKDAVHREGFQKLRRTLKQIVRKKIQNNLKKTEPYSNKRKIKKYT